MSALSLNPGALAAVGDFHAFLELYQPAQSLGLGCTRQDANVSPLASAQLL